MRRTTRLLRLSSGIFSTAAAIVCCSSATIAQQPALPTPPRVTAVGTKPAPPVATPSLPSLQKAVTPPLGGAANAAPAPAVSNVQAPGAANATNAKGVAATPVTTTVTAPATVDPFLAQLDLAIDVSSRRYLTANAHSPWQIFHGLLALKQSFQLNLNGQKVNAIEWIATSEPKFDNQPLLMKTPHGGKFHPFTRPYAFEGHPAQFLALLSQSDLPVTYAFKVGNEQITIGGIINNTMKEVNNREEVTWVLWALQHYLKPDAQWLNQHNEPWSIERLVQIETAAAVVGAPCGGNHRLFALTRTRDKYLKQGGKLVGVWAQADYKIRQHIEIARSMQNYDGTFSAKFYETSGHTTDLNSRFNTTGHTMEFLSIALPNERLNEQWVRNAVFALSNDLVANRQRVIDCGPLYHTLNSLIIYRDRLRQLQKPVEPTPTVPPQVADAGVKPMPTPSISPNSAPVSVDPGIASNPSTAKLPMPEKPAASPTPEIGSESKPADATNPSTQDQPSEEALNELKLEGESRERLSALTAKRTVPAQVPQDQSARPLETIGQPVLQESDEPASALTPENGE